MSAPEREVEAQAKKEEGVASDRGARAAAAAAALKENWCLTLRVAELVIAIMAAALVTGALGAPQVLYSDHRHIAFVYSAYSSFIIITGVLIAARWMGEAVGWKTSITFSAVGALMFAAATALIFFDWYRSHYENLRPNKFAYDFLLSSGIFAAIDAVVFLVHAYTTFKKESEA